MSRKLIEGAVLCYCGEDAQPHKWRPTSTCPGQRPTVNPNPSPRQLEVLEGLDDGLDLEEIAERMRISEDTVKQHTKRLMRRYQVPIQGLPAAARAKGHLPL